MLFLNIFLFLSLLKFIDCAPLDLAQLNTGVWLSGAAYCGKDKYKSMIPLGRFAGGEDIANVCLFLACDMGSYITGQTISACGGMNI